MGEGRAWRQKLHPVPLGKAGVTEKGDNIGATRNSVIEEPGVGLCRKGMGECVFVYTRGGEILLAVCMYVGGGKGRYLLNDVCKGILPISMSRHLYKGRRETPCV